MSTFDAELSLSTLDEETGVRIIGELPGEIAGNSVASAGDVNGDGIADIIVGARRADPQGNSSGAAYVIFGTQAGFPADLDLSTLDGTNGFKINGAVAGEEAGISVAAAGDVNGDGIDDLIVGAQGFDLNGTTAGGESAGAAYVVYGTDGGFESEIDLVALNSATGFRITGAAKGDFTGFSTSSAGDINADGIDDIIVGAYVADPNGSASGAAYVIYGTDADFGGVIDLSSLDPSAGFQISGAAAGDFAGISVASAGDVNGDGIDDLIVGANRADPAGDASGAVYVFFGSDAGFGPEFDLGTIDGTTGIKLIGAAEGDLAGWSVAAAGDINGDGFGDIIIGAYDADPNGDSSGAAYVVFGTDAGLPAEIDLATLDGTTGFKLNGEADFDRAGYSVASAGDVNRDGFDDILVGAYLAGTSPSGTGATYLVFGSDTGFAAEVDLSSLDGETGFQITGEAGFDQSGTSVASAGDVNGDGFDDILVGAPYADADGSDSGAAYIIFGKATRGTTGDDVLKGSAGANSLSGLAGNDDLFGGGGDDILIGGTGNDTLDGGISADTLEGGAGNDTYVTDGSDTLTELDDEGTDTVRSTVSFTLADHFENLTLLGSLGIDGTGNGGNNTVTGNSGANTLDGAGGADTLIGRAGDDTYVTDGGDTITEAAGEGHDVVRSSVSLTLGGNVEELVLLGSSGLTGAGNGGTNTLTGNGGNNVLDGGGGVDTMMGGTGDDSYVTDGGDTITENAGEGNDNVLSSASYILGSNLENLTLVGAAAIDGTGNESANVLVGNSGANSLSGGGGADSINGGGGADIMLGGQGNDTFVTDGGDTITENAGEGTDTVRSSVSFTLGANIENLSLTGSSAINGTGNGGANTLTGNGGSNSLNGGGGADVLTGGAGNDTFVTDGGDTITENAGEGTDTVQSSVSFTLGANVENLTLTGTGAISGTGNSAVNTIIGNGAKNSLNGSSGSDTLTGGSGADNFIFSTTLGGSNVDRITDYNVSADTIRLDDAIFTVLPTGTLKSNAFVKNASGNAADASDRIIYETDTGKVYYDRDGTGAAAKVHFATLGTNLALTSADFIVF